MSSLSSLPADVLGRTEKACDHLTWLYEVHEAIDRELYVKASTLLADVHAVMEDRRAARRANGQAVPTRPGQG